MPTNPFPQTIRYMISLLYITLTLVLVSCGSNNHVPITQEQTFSLSAPDPNNPTNTSHNVTFAMPLEAFDTARDVALTLKGLPQGVTYESKVLNDNQATITLIGSAGLSEGIYPITVQATKATQDPYTTSFILEVKGEIIDVSVKGQFLRQSPRAAYGYGYRIDNEPAAISNGLQTTINLYGGFEDFVNTLLNPLSGSGLQQRSSRDLAPSLRMTLRQLANPEENSFEGEYVVLADAQGYVASSAPLNQEGEWELEGAVLTEVNYALMRARKDINGDLVCIEPLEFKPEDMTPRAILFDFIPEDILIGTPQATATGKTHNTIDLGTFVMDSTNANMATQSPFSQQADGLLFVSPQDAPHMTTAQGDLKDSVLRCNNNNRHHANYSFGLDITESEQTPISQEVAGARISSRRQTPSQHSYKHSVLLSFPEGLVTAIPALGSAGLDDITGDSHLQVPFTHKASERQLVGEPQVTYPVIMDICYQYFESPEACDFEKGPAPLVDLYYEGILDQPLDLQQNTQDPQQLELQYSVSLIKGRVLDKQGQPVTTPSFIIAASFTGGALGFGFSDETGAYVLRVKTGKYNIVAGESVTTLDIYEPGIYEGVDLSPPQ